LTPSFSPAAGSYSSTQTVTISCATPGSSIYFTADGSTPTYPITGTTQLYAGSLGVPSSETINAIAVAAGYLQSVMGSAAYTITSGFTLPSLATIRAAGYLIVTDSPYNADPTGVLDSTAGIQQCLIDASNSNKATYFPASYDVGGAPDPNGTLPAVYLISSPLLLYTWITNGYGGNCFSVLGGYNPNWQATIKIAPSAAAFNAALYYGSYPIPMISATAFGLGNGVNGNGSATVPSHSAQAGINPYLVQQGSTGIASNSSVGSSTWLKQDDSEYFLTVRNLHLDTSQYAHACGAMMSGAQSNAIANISVTATNSWGGFSSLPGTGTPSVGISVTGGTYGLNFESNVSAAQTGAGINIAGLTCIGQTGACVVPGDASGSLIVIGFDLEPTGAGVAFTSADNILDPNPRGQTAVFIDGKVVQASGVVFVNGDSAGGRTLHLRNVFLTGGATQWTKWGNNAARTTSGTWALINEYVSTDQRSSSDPYNGAAATYNIIATSQGAVNSGSKTTTAEPIVTVTPSSAAPPANIVSRHGPLIAAIDTAPMFLITAYGATPGGADCAADINAALAAAAGQSLQTNVVVPNGTWYIANTLNVPANVKLIGIGAQQTIIAAHSSWAPANPGTMANGQLVPVPLIYGASSLNATNGIVGLQLAPTAPSGYDYLTYIHWQSGGACYFFNYVPAPVYTSSAAKALHLFDGNAGGRIYGGCGSNMGEATSYNNPSMSWTTINGTTVPLIFYGVNDYEPIGTMNAALLMQNCQNVMILNLKREYGTPTMIISGSSNCAFIGSSRLSVGATLMTAVQSGCSNLLVAHHFPTTGVPQTELIFEDVPSGVSVADGNALSIYEVGFFNMTVMAMTGT